MRSRSIPGSCWSRSHAPAADLSTAESGEGYHRAAADRATADREPGIGSCMPTGAIAAAAAQEPLLHTWSLAVEEQFYIAFPLFLLVVHRWLYNRCHFPPGSQITAPERSLSPTIPILAGILRAHLGASIFPARPLVRLGRAGSILRPALRQPLSTPGSFCARPAMRQRHGGVSALGVVRLQMAVCGDSASRNHAMPSHMSAPVREGGMAPTNRLLVYFTHKLATKSILTQRLCWVAVAARRRLARASGPACRLHRRGLSTAACERA
jgi:hypothetical protein